MEPKYSDADLEKIRYQLGQIIKSWSKVDRHIDEEYVSYKVGKTEFCYLLDDVVVLAHFDQELAGKIKADFEISNSSHISKLSYDGEVIPLSLQQYEFPDLIPAIESIYRFNVLNHSSQ